MPDECQAALDDLYALLRTLGSANDAEDHGYGADAAQLRAEACAAIRALLAEHAFLGQEFPTLGSELDSGHILGFGWANLADDVAGAMKAHGSTAVIFLPRNDEEPRL